MARDNSSNCGGYLVKKIMKFNAFDIENDFNATFDTMIFFIEHVVLLRDPGCVAW